MSIRYLIINADDYGINDETNKAVEGLFESGGITSASIMSVAENANDAVRMAHERGYSVGVHFTLNSDDEKNRWKSLSNSYSLGDKKGLYYDKNKLTFHARSREVTWELEAQYSFIAKRGVLPDHADSHCGTLYGINGRLFFINAFDFCRKYNLPFRFSKSEAFIHRLMGGRAPSALLPVYRAIVSCGLKKGVKMLDDIITNPFPMSKIRAYEDLRDYYLNEIKNSSPGITEVFLHPANSLSGGSEGEWLKREYELRLLQSGDILQLAEDENIKITSWHDAPFV